MRNLSIVSEVCSLYDVSMIDLFSGFVVPMMTSVILVREGCWEWWGWERGCDRGLDRRLAVPHRVVMRDYRCHRAASNAKIQCDCFCFGGASSTQLSRCQTEVCEQCEVVVVVDYV